VVHQVSIPTFQTGILRVWQIWGACSKASSFNYDISRWNVSSVTNMEDMFYGASSFNSDISNWDVSTVTNMRYMFYSASSFNSEISNWNIGSVNYMTGMFNGASSFNQNLCPWGLKLPLDFDYVNYAFFMFDSSGCLNTDRPKGRTGPWCAVTNCTA